jgi:hypothetical protein
MDAQRANRRGFLKGTSAVMGVPAIIPASAWGKGGSVAPSGRATMAGCGWTATASRPNRGRC